MQKSHLIIYITALFALASCGTERAMKKAEQHQAIGEYYDAAQQYRKAYQQTPAKERQPFETPYVTNKPH